MESRSHLSLRLARLALLPLLAIWALGVLAGCSIAKNASAAQQPGTTQHPVTTTQLSFDILSAKPGGPAHNWPAYVPTSLTALPANSVVTVTIRNFDLGDDTLPANSPYLHVQGTLDGTATADGKTYRSVPANHIAHTFTSTQLQLSVPISGDPVGKADHVTVTFSFRTPSTPGTYYFQCFVPCGTGTSGYNGPMVALGYMRGTVTVVA
jgi:hypothetical protein